MHRSDFPHPGSFCLPGDGCDPPATPAACKPLLPLPVLFGPSNPQAGSRPSHRSCSAGLRVGLSQPVYLLPKFSITEFRGSVAPEARGVWPTAPGGLLTTWLAAALEAAQRCIWMEYSTQATTSALASFARSGALVATHPL